MDELRRYEMYIIFQPELDETSLEARIERVNTFLTNNSGEIAEVARKGKRRLAYPIQRHTVGIDVIYQIAFPSTRLEQLERQLNLSEDVIRYLIVRRDELEQGERLTATEEEIAAEVANLRAQPTEAVDEGVIVGADTFDTDDTADADDDGDDAQDDDDGADAEDIADDEAVYGNASEGTTQPARVRTFGGDTTPAAADPGGDDTANDETSTEGTAA